MDRIQESAIRVSANDSHLKSVVFAFGTGPANYAAVLTAIQSVVHRAMSFCKMVMMDHEDIKNLE